MCKIFNDTGFQITLNNGLTISVQFGQYHYCDNNYSNNNDLSSSKTAEVAVLRDGQLVTREIPASIYHECSWDTSDSVVGHVPPEVLIKIINWANKQG